jgi:enoyl-CoA hydratase/carnithine racemase
MASSTRNQAGQQQQQHVLATLHPNRVLELQLNRPKALNALSSQMLFDLTKHVQQALENEKDVEGNDLIAAVLLTAVEGSRAFSAGGDIKELLGRLLSEKTEAVTKGKWEGMNSGVLARENLPNTPKNGCQCLIFYSLCK